MLAELVKAGKLPPVEDRLPEDPRVIEVVEEIGQYGGTMRRVATGMSDAWIIDSRLSYAGFTRYTLNADEIIPHLVSKWEQNAEGSEYTMYLRKGVKWSDGTPLTAEGIEYYYNDMLLNKELTPSFPAWLTINSEPVVITKLDDYSFKFKFVGTHGLFMVMLASATGQGMSASMAKHYLKQFHPTYASKEDIDKKLAELKLENWWSLHGNRDDWNNPEMPRVWPWVITAVPTAGNPVVFERNPYYWCVDPEGNQLPYIDRIRMDLIESADMAGLKAISGEIDAQWRHITWSNFPLYIENAEKGGYRVLKHTQANGSETMLLPNQCCEDAGLAELFNNKDFRHALSLAINRAEINEVVYNGMGTPRQCSILPTLKYYKPEHSTAWADYDIKKANELLDGIGLTKKDAEGFRLRKDGTPLSIVIEMTTWVTMQDAVEMICQQWRDIGIRATGNMMERSLYQERGNAKTVRQIGVWGMDRCAHPLVDGIYWMPSNEGQTTVGWCYRDWWLTGGKEGVEPPAEVKKAYELYDQCKGAKTEAELVGYATELMDLNAEQTWFIGTVGLLPAVGIVRNNVRNVPETGVADWNCLHPGNTAPEQWYIKA